MCTSLIFLELIDVDIIVNFTIPGNTVLMRGVHQLLIPITVTNSDPIPFGVSKDGTNYNITMFFTNGTDTPTIYQDSQDLQFPAVTSHAQSLGLQGTESIHINTSYNVSLSIFTIL